MSDSFALNSLGLSDEELAQFDQRGFIGPFTLYKPEEIQRIWRQERIRLLDRTAAVYQDATAKGGTNIANYDRHLDNEFLADHICRPEIVDRVVSVLGPDVLCWRTEFFPKYPGDEGTDWHQADTFANVSGTPQILWPGQSEAGGTITVWCAFTEATVERGALQFIPGTHHTRFYDETKRMEYRPEQVNSLGKNGVPRGFFGYDYRDLQIDPEWSPDEDAAESMVMKAGQFIMFWSTLMHASHPHSGMSKGPRIGFAARYVPTSVRIYPGSNSIEEYGGKISLDRYGAVLVSGTDTYGHNRMAQYTTRNHPFSTARTRQHGDERSMPTGSAGLDKGSLDA